VNGFSIRCFLNENQSVQYDVTYTDGVDGEVIFPDEVYSVQAGDPYPTFQRS
jgi:hypothetical protein